MYIVQQVNLVIRLRQSRDRDTMVSSCAVHGERGAEEEERQRRRGQVSILKIKLSTGFSCWNNNTSQLA